jgi:hypothetical protein
MVRLETPRKALNCTNHPDRSTGRAGASGDAGIQLYMRWVELLKELVPNLSSIFYLGSQSYWEREQFSVSVRAGAKHAGTSLIPILLGPTFNEAAYESAFKSMDQDRADALLVSKEAEHVAYRAVPRAFLKGCQPPRRLPVPSQSLQPDQPASA